MPRAILTGALLLVTLSSCGGAPARAGAPASANAGPEALPQRPPAPPDSHAAIARSPTEFPDVEAERLTPPDRALHERARAAAREGRLAEAKRILGHLAFAYAEHTVLVDQYNAVCAKMEAARATAKASLEATPLLKLEPPPAKETLVRPVPLEDRTVPRLVKRSEKKNEIVDEERWFKTNEVHRPEYFVPPAYDMLFAPGTIATTTVANLLTGFQYTEYEPSARFDPRPLPLGIPLAYGTLPLTRAIDSAPHIVAIYGAHVVAVFDGPERVKALFDLEAFRHPPADRATPVVVGKATLTTPERTESADLTVDVHSITLDLKFALAAEGALYVEHAANAYAKESRNQTAYISALGLEDGALMWRSAPLVANANTFALSRGGVVCGYGFTAEPDFLFVLDRATGKTKQKVPVRTGPEEILATGRGLYVRTYDTDLVFDLK